MISKTSIQAALIPRLPFCIKKEPFIKSGSSNRCIIKIKKQLCVKITQNCFYLVEVTRFELATSTSRTQRSTKLSHTSKTKVPRKLLRHSSLAAALGFEPRHTESESAVLPLHNAAKLLSNSNIYYIKFLLKVNTFLKKTLKFSKNNDNCQFA